MEKVPEGVPERRFRCSFLGVTMQPAKEKKKIHVSYKFMVALRWISYRCFT